MYSPLSYYYACEIHWALFVMFGNKFVENCINMLYKW